MERFYSGRWFHAAVLFVIAVSVLIVYSNTYTTPFQFDDMSGIAQNRALRNIENFIPLLKRGRGISQATFLLNYAVGGLDTFGYHIVNTVIHIINAWLAYFLLLFTFRLVGGAEPWSRRLAAFAALIFALHPIQTQAVTYIIQRMESLGALFYLAALLFFVRSALTSSALKRWVLYACVGVSYVLAFYTKEITLTLPAIVLLYDLYFLRGRGHGRILARLPLYAMLAILLVYFTVTTVAPLGGFGDLSAESAAGAGQRSAQITEAVEGKMPLTPPTAGFGVMSISPKHYLYTQFNVLVYYVALLAVPINQNLDYDFPIAKGLFESPHKYDGTVMNLPNTPPVISLVILVSFLALALYLLRRSRTGGREGGGAGRIVSFSIFWFFILLSPTSSFIPISDVIFEHRVYLASLGYFAIFVICVDSIATSIFKRKPSGEERIDEA